jgi:hypothetical protein
VNWWWMPGAFCVGLIFAIIDTVRDPQWRAKVKAIKVAHNEARAAYLQRSAAAHVCNRHLHDTINGIPEERV